MWWHFPYLPWLSYDGKATLIAFHRHWSLQHLQCQPSSQTCVCAGKLIWLFGTLGGWQEAGAPFKQPKYKDEGFSLPAVSYSSRRKMQLKRESRSTDIRLQRAGR